MADCLCLDHILRVVGRFGFHYPIYLNFFLLQSHYCLVRGSQQTPTLFSLYIDDISNYVEKFGGSRSCLARLVIQILLFTIGIR